jgi:hypothetical protein
LQGDIGKAGGKKRSFVMNSSLIESIYPNGLKNELKDLGLLEWFIITCVYPNH